VFVFAIGLSEMMVVLCKQNVLLLVAAERFNTITNAPASALVHHLRDGVLVEKKDEYYN
jgi:hypothetical protein